MPAPGDKRPEPRVGKRFGRVLMIIGGVVAAAAFGVGIGVIPFPGAQDSTQSAGASAQGAHAAKRLAANRRWASATCTNILDWKHEIQHDATSLNLSLGALGRIQDAVAATTRMSNEVNALGLPPAAQTAQARAEIEQLRSDIESPVHNVEGAARTLASGNLAAAGALLSDLENERLAGTRIVTELRRVVSVDLGLSLVETRACRQLVGIPI